jgi:DNA-binding response OmpR family regulator
MDAMDKLRKFRLILVEDDHDLRQGLVEYLELRGFDVAEASSGEEFQRAIDQSHYDVAILDVNLPDVSGFDLARQLAATGSTTGIIMLTARHAREDRLHGYDRGADLYFTKPVDSEELALAAANLARRLRNGKSASAPSPDPVRPPPAPAAWTLDRTLRTLKAPDGPMLQLSGRESMLLEFLAQRKDVLVPRSDVLEVYADAAPDPTSRRFDVAFARLRLKATEAGTVLPVQVVRGSGLRLIAAITIV